MDIFTLVKLTTIILGQQDDEHVIAVAEKLNNPIILDDETIEYKVQITAGLHSLPALFVDDELITPTSVYWRNLDLDPFETEHFPNDVAYFKLFLESLKNANMVNPLNSFVDHYTKLDQLRKLSVLIPPSLITNRYEDAANFASNYSKTVVKPIAGGAYLQDFSEVHAFFEPMMVQAFIEGENIRTFVFGDKVLSAVAVSELDDFRLDANLTYKPIELSSHENELAKKIAYKLGYKWTAIDWIRRDENLFFLEANFSPMFLYFEEQTGYPITDSLVDLLIK